MNRVAFLVAVVLSRVQCALSDFLYADFNATVGLIFNGAARSTDCEEESPSLLDLELQGDDDDDVSAASRLYQHGRTATTDVFSTVETSKNSSFGDEIATHEAVFGHRREFEVGEVSGCSTRVRLTPSHPSKAGSVWYESRVPVVRIDSKVSPNRV